MKPKIYAPECPAHLIKKAEEQHLAELGLYNYNRYTKVIWQDERDGLLYAYIHSSRKLIEEGILTPEYLIAADMTSKKWNTYDFQDQRWNSKMLESIVGYYDPIEEYIDKDRYGKSLREMQREVREEEARKRREKKNQQIQGDMDKAENLPDAFLTWAERQLPPYILYEPGDNHRGYCTRCKGEITTVKKLETHKMRTCPRCRSRCMVKTLKLAPEVVSATTIYIQGTDTGIMVRYIHIYKRKKEGYKNQKLEISEGLRVVIDRGKKQKWYEKRQCKYGDTLWYRNNVDNWIKSINNPYSPQKSQKQLTNIRKDGGLPIYKRNLLHVIRDCNLKYVDDWTDMMNEIHRYKEKIDDFIDLYDYFHRFPQMESLWKMNFRTLAADIMMYPSDIKKEEKELHKTLGISKEMWRYLQKKQEKKEISLRDIKAARQYDKATADKALAWEAAKRIPNYYSDTMRGLNLRKLVRYLRKNKAQVYGDYLLLARDLGYDLGDDFVAFPKDLEAAHDEALEVRDEERNKKELANAEKDDPGIRKVYRKIRKKYTDEIDGFLFRPAKSNYEIVKEGQTLHHCVGRGVYKRKMMDEISYIIFMRKKESPEEPCYTIEISPEGKILQAYGKYDKEPGSDTDRQIIKQYAMKVRERLCQEASCRKTGHTVTGAAQTA